jgi:xanthosine utilization system XapX-like protein
VTTTALIHVVVSGLATGSIYALMAMRQPSDPMLVTKPKGTQLRAVDPR